MTLVSEAVTDGDPPADDEATKPPSQRARGVRRRVRRTVTLAVVGVAALLAVYAFFSAFVTHLWFDSRQRALAASGISLVAPRTGSPVGVLQAQQPFTLNVQLVQGDGPDQLRAGPGHRPDTPLPGALGNSVVYGHASQWGAPFKHLKEADKGTELYLRTPKFTLLGYTVILAKVVPESQVSSYLGRSTDYRLTLVTDAGGRFSDRRLVVVAVSGTRGHLEAARPGASADPPKPSPLGIAFLEFLAWVALAAGVGWMLARSHSRAVCVVATTPLVLAALVAGFLELGLLWNPLA